MKKSDRFTFDIATAADSREILEILEEGYYKGNISLLYTRREDAYASLMREGEEVTIITCRDTKEDKIAAIALVAIRNLYINGKKKRVGFLSSLKARGEYRQVFHFLHHGYAYFKDIYRQKKLPFYLMTVLEDNDYAIKLFAKRRTFMPNHYGLGTYAVHAFKTGLKTKYVPGFAFKRCTTEEFPEVLAFLNGKGKSQQFFPVLQAQDFQVGSRYGLQAHDFYALRDKDNHILAAGAVWDQKEYKQYLVKGYKGIYKCLSPISSLLPIFGYPHMLSKAGTVLNFFTLSFWAVKDDNPAYFNRFIRLISQANQAYRFFVLGMHEDNTLKEALNGIPHFSYRSKIFLADWDKSGHAMSQLDRQRVTYLECGTL
jgi:hypothetical protein